MPILLLSIVRIQRSSPRSSRIADDHG